MSAFTPAPPEGLTWEIGGGQLNRFSAREDGRFLDLVRIEGQRFRISTYIGSELHYLTPPVKQVDLEKIELAIKAISDKAYAAGYCDGVSVEMNKCQAAMVYPEIQKAIANLCQEIGIAALHYPPDPTLNEMSIPNGGQR